ncbi:MAG: PfkB family carbohydrate kinase [Victivallales bacterium]|jgi:fructose-1-phosphate kinase PfkB-like protein|nr:PfkB family carbohydrate kinase [Victivallales bacterium]
MKNIAVLGPNPAWQKTLFFKQFQYGKINRAIEMQEFPAGKGINFCRAATCYGKTTGHLIQFTGGENGKKIRSELNKEGMSVFSVETKGATRCCTTCLCRTTQNMTEIIEPSFAADSAEIGMLLDYFEDALDYSDAGAFCGTLPTGTDPALYFRAAQIAIAQKKPLLLDSYLNLLPVFKSDAELWLKINAEELQALTGEKTIEAGLAKLFEFPAVKLAAVTDGAGRAYATDGKKLAIYTLPRLETVVNPIGCGDTASAVWASELLEDADPFEAFRLALACASANCLSAFPGSFSPADATKIAEQIDLQFTSR